MKKANIKPIPLARDGSAKLSRGIGDPTGSVAFGVRKTSHKPAATAVSVRP